MTDVKVTVEFILKNSGKSTAYMKKRALEIVEKELKHSDISGVKIVNIEEDVNARI